MKMYEMDVDFIGTLKVGGFRGCASKLVYARENKKQIKKHH